MSRRRERLWPEVLREHWWLFIGLATVSGSLAWWITP